MGQQKSPRWLYNSGRIRRNLLGRNPREPRYFFRYMQSPLSGWTELRGRNAQEEWVIWENRIIREVEMSSEEGITQE